MTPFTSTARDLAVLLSLALMGTGAAAGEINSQLQIEAGQTFELGGGQRGGFTVTGKNTGPVAVVVYALREGGTAPAERGTVVPGGTVNAAFGPGEQALLRNTSGRETARLKLKISGDTSSLGMTYSANP